MLGSRWRSAAHVRRQPVERGTPPSQFNQCVDSWDVDRVPDHRRQLDKITPLDAANNADDSDDAREYALDKIGKQG